ncbi:MAG: hypothetical protein D3924_00725 [Candidatus Electrothrix sp. AR4]|nr:hypothetical protein [Candidatus Electrothrix sp. AR4]
MEKGMRMNSVLFVCCVSILLSSGCAKLDPRQVEIDIPSGAPEVKTTEIKESLRKLGRMAEIYGEEARIMLDKIGDNTGTSIHTKAEVPYDVTEMTASALNSIGGNITFVPYRPDIMMNLQSLGYQIFDNKYIPSVIVTGGITEFDRGLKTREASTDLGYETTEFGQKSPVGIEYSQGKKESVARITIDYNMINLASMSGLSGIQTTNTMQLHKGIGEKELGLTLFGPTLGLKGEIKKVEGRHGALRLLVQASMIQLVGKYLDLPYWRLLPGASPDPVVESYVSRGWNYQMNINEQIHKIQELLFLHGHEDIHLTGQRDQTTDAAINKFADSMKCSKKIDFDLYSALYYNLPLDDETLHRRYALV